MSSKKSKLDLISETKFNQIVKESNSIREILVKIGYKNTSGTMHNKIKKRINDNNLCIKHMGNKINQRKGKRTPLEQILIENSTYQNIERLKIRLVNEGKLEYKCVKCGNEGEWMGEPISLQLDHINGVRNDHRLENLRFLCPNCHSQTPTYGGKNIKGYASTLES